MGSMAAMLGSWYGSGNIWGCRYTCSTAQDVEEFAFCQASFGMIILSVQTSEKSPSDITDLPCKPDRACMPSQRHACNSIPFAQPAGPDRWGVPSATCTQVTGQCLARYMTGDFLGYEIYTSS